MDSLVDKALEILEKWMLSQEEVLDGAIGLSYNIKVTKN